MNTRIKEIRKSKTVNLSQREFGRRLGVKDTAISKIESGENSLTPQMILAICREFDVNEKWLRTGNGEMFNENDDTVIAAVVDEYGLDDLDEKILRAYIELPDDIRKGANAFIKELARYALEDDVNIALGTAYNNIDNTYRGKGKSTGAVLEDIKDGLEEAFSNVLPPVRCREKQADSPPPATPSKLEVLKNSDEELEKEADEFAEKAKQQFIFEKKQALQASSAKESGAG